MSLSKAKEGTVCEGNRIKREEGGECSPVGGVKCWGERRFVLCDEGTFGSLG